MVFSKTLSGGQIQFESSNVLFVDLTAADTSLLTAGPYSHELVLTVNGQVSTVSKGTIQTTDDALSGD